MTRPAAGVHADATDATTSTEAPVEREDRGLWVFVLGDMTVFALFFVVLLVEYRADRAGFAAAAGALALPIGVVNTVVLLTGSYLVVLATGAHRDGVTATTARLLRGATASAAVFVVLKAVEYAGVIGALDVPPAAGPSPSGLFTALYFVVTGLHLLHVLVGAALLELWRRRAARGQGWSRFTVAGAVYWHLVDLLWVVIFSLVYLVARTP